MKPPTIDSQEMLRLPDDTLRANIKAQYDLEETEENNKHIEQCMKFINQVKQEENLIIDTAVSYSCISWQGFRDVAYGFYYYGLPIRQEVAFISLKPNSNRIQTRTIIHEPPTCFRCQVFPINLTLNEMSCIYSNWHDILIDKSKSNNGAVYSDVVCLIYSALAKLNESLVFKGKSMFGLPDGEHHPLDCMKISGEVDAFNFPNTHEALRCLLFICTLHALANGSAKTAAQLKNKLKIADPASYLLLPSCDALTKLIKDDYRILPMLGLFSMFYALRDYKRHIYYPCTRALKTSAKAIDLSKQVAADVKMDTSDLIGYLGFRQFYARMSAVSDDLNSLNVVSHFSALGINSKTFSFKENSITCFALAITQCLVTGNPYSMYIPIKRGTGSYDLQSSFIKAVSFSVCQYILATESDLKVAAIYKEIIHKVLKPDESDINRYLSLSMKRKNDSLIKCVMCAAEEINRGEMILQESSKYFYEYWLFDVRYSMYNKLDPERMNTMVIGKKLEELYTYTPGIDFSERKYIDVTLPQHATKSS